MSQLTRDEIVDQLCKKKITPDQAKQALAELDAVQAQANQKPITFKVGEKGGVSVYGLNVRFPVTLYASQWERLIAAIPQLQAFIEANRPALADKESKKAA